MKKTNIEIYIKILPTNLKCQFPYRILNIPILVIFYNLLIYFPLSVKERENRNKNRSIEVKKLFWKNKQKTNCVEFFMCL